MIHLCFACIPKHLFYKWRWVLLSQYLSSELNVGFRFCLCPTILTSSTWNDKNNPSFLCASRHSHDGTCSIHFRAGSSNPTKKTGLSALKYLHKRSVLVRTFKHQQLRDMAKDPSKRQSHATRNGHPLGLTEDLCDVNCR